MQSNKQFLRYSKKDELQKYRILLMMDYEQGQLQEQKSCFSLTATAAEFIRISFESSYQYVKDDTRYYL